MGTTIKLYYVDRNVTYKEWELIPNKLLVVEDIASYLATKTALTINNFQYIKNKLELGINIDLSQSYSQPKTSTSFKYISIQNEGEMTHYYFVKEAEWRSKSCVRFELVMDVLNTFEENKDYTFKANTRIVREHKDRITRTPLELNIAIGNNVSDVGLISVGDNINLYREISGDFTLICRAEVLYIAEELISLKVISSETYKSIIESINAGITYEDLFQISKDNSNYREAFFTSLDIFYKFERKIDDINENINPVLQCGSAEGKLLEDKSILNQDWYLLYRNQNDPTESLVNPVDCYLIPENLTKVNVGSLVNGAIVPATLNSGMYYYLNIRDMNNEITLSNGVSLSPSKYNQPNMVIVKKQANGLLNVVFIFDPVNINNTYTRTYNDIEYITINHFPLYYYESATQIDTEYWIDNIMGNETDSWNEDSVEVYIDNIDLVDRTDAKNIKLIKLPYCPYEFEIIGDKLQIVSTQWSYVSLVQPNTTTIHALKLDNLSTKLQHTIKEDSQINPFSNFNITDTDELEPAITDLRKTEFELESKLFHSEFYSPQLVYDSFAFRFDLEKVNQEWYYESDNNKLTITFLMTKTINSKFLFSMTTYKLSLSESNYATYLPVARNNEEVLYNVPYINYIRTGFNYDVKSKNLQNVSNAIGLGLSAASFGVAMALPSAPLKVAGIVAAAISMAMSVKNTITSTIQNEDSIRAKQEQYKNQASSIAGSDDVDLMSEYAKNRIKYVEYKPTPKMTALLKELFFYAGYNSGRLGIPTHNNRMNFDYLECEASIQAISSIPRDCLDELINSFKNGVTYLHKTTRTTDKWDFEQKYENWERTLLED